MATVLIPVQQKGTATPGRAPTVAEVLERQLFVNLADRRIYTKDTDNQIITLGVASSDFATVAFTGEYADLAGLPTIPPPYTLPQATQTLLGGVRIGNGLSINMGLVSAVITSLRGEFGITKTGDVVLTRADLGLDILDSNDLIKPEYLPSSITGALTYRGTWDASTNTPEIPAADSSNLNWFYVCSVAGTADVAGQGEVEYNVGDQLISNGAVWQRIPFVAATVLSVNGQTGAVEITAANLPGLSLVGRTNDYNDLSNKPVLGDVATSNDYNDLDNLPDLADVATSGSYNDLLDLPPDPRLTDVGVQVNGTPVLNPAEFVFARPMQFAANFAGSRAFGRVSTGTQIQVRIMKSLAAAPTSFTQVGTLTINVTTQTATFTTIDPNPVSFAEGDILRYEWISTSISSISITLRATRL